jgi:hypothetical protein
MVGKRVMKLKLSWIDHITGDKVIEIPKKNSSTPGMGELNNMELKVFFA